MARFAPFRVLPLALSLPVALALIGPVAANPPAAEPQAPAPAPAPKLDDEAKAVAAVAPFKEAWKAKGLKGEEKLAQRDWALSELVKVHHPLIVAELGDVARSGDESLRTLAVIYLGDQKALPALAGEQVLAALKKHGGDTVLVLSALQSLASLKYLGSDELLKDLLRSEDFVVKKAAIAAVGQVGDMRLIDELLKILGVDPKAPPPAAGGKEEKSGGKEVVEEGYSWEGAEAVVDHGHADNSAGERRGEGQGRGPDRGQQGRGPGRRRWRWREARGAGGARPAAAAARRAARTSSSPTSSSRSRALTGETFMTSTELRKWLGANSAKIEQGKAACDVKEAEQKKAPAK